MELSLLRFITGQSQRLRLLQISSMFQGFIVILKSSFKNEKLDFVDIITDVDTHSHFVKMALENGIKYIICQKPMAPDFETALKMVNLCKASGARLYVHENYRWQAPVRRFKQIIDSGVIGKPFKARVSFLSGFPVFDNQPFLRELDHFILTDMGSHVFDVVRFLFGECESLWCQTKAVNKGIKGEDLAVIMMEMANGMPVIYRNVVCLNS